MRTVGRYTVYLTAPGRMRGTAEALDIESTPDGDLTLTLEGREYRVDASLLVHGITSAVRDARKEPAAAA